MSTANYYSGRGTPPELSTEDRRTHAAATPGSPHRRIDDSWFNRVRWPAFIAFWIVMGFVVFAYLFGKM